MSNATPVRSFDVLGTSVWLERICNTMLNDTALNRMGLL
jgi:hypothetical protein